MARRRRALGGEELETDPRTPGEQAADDAIEAGYVPPQLPTLPVPALGKAEKAVDPPIFVFIRDPRGAGASIPAEIIGMECQSGMNDQGLKVQAMRAGETVYIVRRRDTPAGQKPVQGTFPADQLILPAAMGLVVGG